MDIMLKRPLPDSPRNILRRAGYSEHFDPKMQKTSYSLRLGGGRYPRFHCYVKETPEAIGFSLHIDQKKPVMKERIICTPANMTASWWRKKWDGYEDGHRLDRHPSLSMTIKFFYFASAASTMLLRVA